MKSQLLLIKIMKIQIITKLQAQQQPHHLQQQPHHHHHHNQQQPQHNHHHHHQSHHNQQPTQHIVHSHHKYYQDNVTSRQTQIFLVDDKTSKNRSELCNFFNRYQYDNLVYQKVEAKFKEIPFRRKLLFVDGKQNRQSSAHNDYQFSFKKRDNKIKFSADSNKQKIKTEYSQAHAIPMPPNSPQTAYLRNYLLSSKPTRIRKFSSLATISSQHSRNSHLLTRQQNSIPTHLVAAARKENSLQKIIRLNGKKVQAHRTCASQFDAQTNQCNNAEDIVEGSKNAGLEYVRQKLKTEVNFSEQKERLCRIRKQLNDIYQLRKVAPQFKLKLY